MVEDYSSANDGMKALLFGCVPAISTLLGYEPQIIYQGLLDSVRMPTDELWMRFSRQSVIDKQVTLRGDEKRRFGSAGFVYIQLFIPKTKLEDYALAEKVASIIQAAFSGKYAGDCIWFRDVTIRELPDETAWQRLNVVAEFQYDTTR